VRRRHLTFAAAGLIGSASVWARRRRHADAGAAASGYRQRAEVSVAARLFAQEHELEPAWIEETLAQARYVPKVAQLMMPPTSPSARNWAAYRSRFIERQRIDAGRQWWERHADVLDESSRRWGVPAEIIVGIVGVETFYGRLTGGFRVLDALATLAFDFPKGRSDRSPYFLSELGHYLALTRREAWQPAAVMGSYAGAMGLPQFMPSSLRNYGVDLDDDGRVDLFGSAADVAASVAYYLDEHGWQQGMPTHFAVEAPSDAIDRATLLVPDIVPAFTAREMQERGARLSEAGQAHDEAMALIELRNGDAPPSYVAGTRNFYAITRYNASSDYAMAVIELGAAVAAARR
jgi:membrane-bound lytic murein transglycosylase B